MIGRQSFQAPFWACWILFCVIGFSLLAVSSEASAHTKAPKIVPADGSVLSAPPESLAFSFPEAVRLTAVRLYDSADSEIGLPGERDMSAAKERLILLPPLAAGAYRVEWRALSADGHPVSGAFSFTVSPAN